VLLWYAGLSMLLVWLVFRSPAVDNRMVVLGAVLPVIPGLLGLPGWFHGLLLPSLALVAVLLVARGRRLRQRALLGIPIGMFLFLVLDFAWTETTTFWWPFLGTEVEPLQWPDRPVPVLVLMELVGLAVLAWCWVRFGLTDPDRRQRFWRTGQLDRDVVGGPGPGAS
jgi:hypothetical protein